MPSIRILFVDDEPSIRATLPVILRKQGFDVAVAENVPEALDLINRGQFDVLISDLNIGEPGDGFTVVSAMRRSQPNAVTFILTGYPDFETALTAIRNQVDDYLIKPANARNIIDAIHDRIAKRSPSRPALLTLRVSELVRQETSTIIEEWYKLAEADPDVSAIKLTKHERIDHLPEVLHEIAERINSRSQTSSERAAEASAVHGKARYEQGYTIPLLVIESRLLQRAIAATLQANLLAVDISMVIADLIQIGETLTSVLEEAIRSFQRQERLAA